MKKTAVIPCTKEEIDAIIEAAIMDDFAYMLFLVAKKTGRRLGEYYDVQVKDIDLEKGIMVTKVLKRRKKVEKEAILDKELVIVLNQYIKRNRLKLEDYIFRKVGYRQIQNKVKTYAKKAGIKHNVCFHNFRHYFITQLVKKGWSYDKIAKLTGHSSIGTLSIYDHVVASDIQEDAIEAMRDM